MAKDAKLKIVVDAENRTQGVFKTLQGNLDTIRSKHEGLRDAMQTVGTAGTVALGGLALLTKGVIQAGANFEQTGIAFETMLGSADLARKTLADLASFAARTPFELPQLEEASKRLLAYGVSAGDLLPTLRNLGDIAAGVGMDKLPYLITALGQVKATTILSGEELRQFTENGVPLMEELARVTGYSVKEIAGDTMKLGITYDQVNQALANLTGEGGRFFNLMERQSQTLGGQWSAFKDQISLTARAIGTELSPYLKPMLDNLIGIAQQVGEFVKQHPQLSAFLLMGALGFSAILAILLPVAIALPGLILMFTALTAGIAAIAAPAAAMILVFGSITAGLLYLREQGYFTKEAWLEVWTGIKIIAAQGANAVIGTVESMINFVISGVNKAIAAINRVIGLAQKVPGIGSKFGKIGELGTVELGRYDTGMIAASSLKGAYSAPAQNNVVLTGNTFLSEDAAEQMGNLMLKKLGLSNAF